MGVPINSIDMASCKKCLVVHQFKKNSIFELIYLHYKGDWNLFSPFSTLDPNHDYLDGRDHLWMVGFGLHMCNMSMWSTHIMQIKPILHNKLL